MLCTELSGDMGRTVIVLISEERVTDDRMLEAGPCEGESNGDIEGDDVRSVTPIPVLPNRLCLIGDDERDEALQGLGERGPIGADASQVYPEAGRSDPVLDDLKLTIKFEHCLWAVKS